MASNPAPADAANTAVRAFLFKAGARLWGRTYNIKSGEGKKIWLDISSNVFDNKCAYCGSDTKTLTLDHVEMINRTSLGLHHPEIPYHVVPYAKLGNLKEEYILVGNSTLEKFVKIEKKRKNLNYVF